jgi:hypothetical protein
MVRASLVEGPGGAPRRRRGAGTARRARRGASLRLLRRPAPSAAGRAAQPRLAQPTPPARSSSAAAAAAGAAANRAARRHTRARKPGKVVDRPEWWMRVIAFFAALLNALLLL